MQCTVLLFGQSRSPLRPGWLLLVASEGSVMAMSMGSLRSADRLIVPWAQVDLELRAILLIILLLVSLVEGSIGKEVIL